MNGSDEPRDGPAGTADAGRRRRIIFVVGALVFPLKNTWATRTLPPVTLAGAIVTALAFPTGLRLVVDTAATAAYPVAAHAHHAAASAARGHAATVRTPPFVIELVLSMLPRKS